MTEEKVKRDFLSEMKRDMHAVQRMEKKAGAGGGVLALFSGFFLGGTALPMGVYPLGAALAGALPSRAVPMLLGVLLRCGYMALLGERILLPMLSSMTIVLIRALLCLWIYGKTLFLRAGKLPDSLFSRVTVTLGVSLLFSLGEILHTGITAEKTYAMLFSAVTAGAFCFLFAFFFDGTHRGTPAYEAGAGAFVFALALSGMPFALGKFSIGLFLSFALTLLAGGTGTPAKSATAGLLCGIASGGYFGPVMALAGLVSAMFSEVQIWLSAMASVLVTVSATLYFGSGADVISLLPELILASFLTALFLSLGLCKGNGNAEDEEKDVLAVLLSRKKEEEHTRRMEGFSHAMAALSDEMRRLSGYFKKPRPKPLVEAARDIWREKCESCRHDCPCRGLAEPESEKALERLVSRLMSEGRLGRERLYELTETRCPFIETIAERISLLAADMLDRAVREEKTDVFAAEYEALSGMLAAAVRGGDMPLSPDKPRSDRLRRALTGAGLYPENALVLGDRKKTVILTGADMEKGAFDLGAVRVLCEESIGVPLGKPFFMLEGGKSALVMESGASFSVRHAVYGKTKRGETVSGDSSAVFENADGYRYALLCDGMGSGVDAAMTAGLCRVFLEKMLLSGNKKSITMEMLNRFLGARGAESFAAIDLLEIDLVLGIASFIKSGAPPSYLIRGGAIRRISSDTFPIGILPELSSEYRELELMDGDLLLLLSDGVHAAFDEDGEGKLSAFLSGEETAELSLLAEKLVLHAEALTGGGDDMTAIFLTISRGTPALSA